MYKMGSKYFARDNYAFLVEMNKELKDVHNSVIGKIFEPSSEEFVVIDFEIESSSSTQEKKNLFKVLTSGLINIEFDFTFLCGRIEGSAVSRLFLLKNGQQIGQDMETFTTETGETTRKSIFQNVEVFEGDVIGVGVMGSNNVSVFTRSKASNAVVKAIIIQNPQEVGVEVLV